MVEAESVLQTLLSIKRETEDVISEGEERQRQPTECGGIFFTKVGEHTFICDLCGEPFHELEQLRTHLKAKHKGPKYSQSKISNTVEGTNCESVTNTLDRPEDDIITVIEIANDDVDEEQDPNDKTSIAKSTVEPRISCDFCAEVFNSDWRLRDHVAARHGNRVPVWFKDDPTYLICEWCNQQNETPSERYEHERTHTTPNGLYSCPLCYRTYKDRTFFRYHLDHHRSIRPFACSYCPRTFNCPDGMDKHLLTHLETCRMEHTEEYVAADRDIKEDADSIDTNASSLGSKDSFDGKNQILKSIKLDESVHNSFNQVVAKIVSEVVSEDSITCEFCQNVFKIEHNFRAHVVSVHGNRIPKLLQDDPTYLTCDRCNKRFATPLERRAHEQMHKSADPYHCPHCPKICPTRSGRRTHITLHTGIRPYHCRICPLTFCRRASIVAHIRSHLGIKPFPCNTCGKRFRTGYQRKAHISIHTKEKPHRCAECGAQFRLLRNLRLHSLCHSEK